MKSKGICDESISGAAPAIDPYVAFLQPFAGPDNPEYFRELHGWAHCDEASAVLHVAAQISSLCRSELSLGEENDIESAQKSVRHARNGGRFHLKIIEAFSLEDLAEIGPESLRFRQNEDWASRRGNGMQ